MSQRPKDSAFTSASSSLEQVPSSLAQSLQRAIEQRDPKECRRLAELAGGARESEAVEALCTLLTMPSRKRFFSRRKDWAWARIAAVNALGRIANPEALHALSDALFDPNPLVREGAAFTLQGFGAQALPHLIRELRGRPDWSTHSMQLLIATLGKIGNRRATPALVHVLAEQIPVDPARWDMKTFVRPLLILFGLFSCWWTIALMLWSGSTDFPGYLQALLVLFSYSAVPFLITYMVSVFVFSMPIVNISASRERDKLTAEALRALALIGDNRTIPEIAEIAFGLRVGPRGHGRSALKALLPRLMPEDTTHFPKQTQQHLARGLTSCDPDLEIEIIRALEHIGSEDALEAVLYASRHGATEEARREANRIIPVLQARVQQERTSSSLLRAASSPSTSPELLLRSGMEGDMTPSDELLRPVEATPESQKEG